MRGCPFLLLLSYLLLPGTRVSVSKEQESELRETAREKPQLRRLQWGDGSALRQARPSRYSEFLTGATGASSSSLNTGATGTANFCVDRS